jgi:MbtH protein
MAESGYLVVLNDEEQYSIWDRALPLPGGWRAEGFTGSEEECLGYIDQVWVDMTPRSLRVVGRKQPADR